MAAHGCVALKPAGLEQLSGAWACCVERAEWARHVRRRCKLGQPPPRPALPLLLWSSPACPGPGTETSPPADCLPAYSLLFCLTFFCFFLPAAQELIQFDSLVTVNTVIASVCLAVVLAVAALLLFRIWAGESAWKPAGTGTESLFPC